MIYSEPTKPANTSYAHAWTPLFAPRAIERIKSLRGGAQAQLLRCDDNSSYVVKCTTNPQGHRILANEWIATAVAHYAGITTPDVTPVWLDEDFIAATPDLAIRLGNRSFPVQPGYHFASQYVGDDQHDAYDYLPDTLLTKISNLPDFLGVLVIDKLLGNADARQCVFVRTDRSFRAYMIDFGYVFNGPNWDFSDQDLCGLYPRSLVYETLSSPAALEPWLSRIETVPFRIFSDAFETMPPEWLAPEDPDALKRLLRTAHARRHTLRTSLTDLFSRRRTTHFSAWRQGAA